MNVFLTGSSRGIGKEIKNIFEENGHNVFFPNRNEMDLSDLDKVKNYLNNFKDDIHILINNAGVSNPKNLIDIEIEEFQKISNINFNSHFLITQHFLKKFIFNNINGKILNIGSIRITELKEGRFEYSLNKNSLHTMTKYIVKECSKHNIICNTLSPGFVDTEMLHKNNNFNKINDMLNTIPIKRFANKREISEIVYFLCVNNSYINGQNIIIDGGLSCI